MKSYLHEIAIDSDADMSFVDITDRVRGVLAESGVRDGIAVVFSSHTTAGVKIIERCERLQADMREYLENAVPPVHYRHDEHTVDDRPNGRRHVMALFTNASETIPVVDGRLAIGQWQSVFFVELDGPRKGRRVLVKILGI